MSSIIFTAKDFCCRHSSRSMKYLGNRLDNLQTRQHDAKYEDSDAKYEDSDAKYEDSVMLSMRTE